MEIEQLNKTQIIMLALLVSFVTSLATGIVTVSLMDQAPKSFTQTVNQIVEKTVEKVVPSPISNMVSSNKETTVIVKDEDVVATAVESFKPMIVSVNSKYVGEDGLAKYNFVGWGIILNNSGLVASDAGFISEGDSYSVSTEDGTRYEAKVLGQNEETGVASIQILKNKDKDGKDLALNLTTPKRADESKLKIGQTVMSFGGRGVKGVSLGIIGELKMKEVSNASTTSSVLVSIQSNAVPLFSISGGPLINKSGELVGMSTSAQIGERGAFYLPVSYVYSEAMKLAVPK